ncbi:MAG TPA: hypothetical protein VJ622_04090 [Acidimicrobiia bacterium]|nr:hypothetical protein [Acidimicrobiia bacterium]HMC80845.1 hypothetical protein [Acidimicrobiia bacterium]
MIVTVEPPGFSLVNFDAGRIAALAAEVGALVGVPDDVAVEIDVDEKSPFGKASGVVAGRSVTLSIEGGAFEDPQRLRQFSEDGARLVLGRLLYRVVDRLDPAFGGPPADADLTKAEHAAWDAYSLGRYARRAGVDGGRARRRYAFRIRHGFSDASDRAFDQLWGGSGLTWADIKRIRPA